MKIKKSTVEELVRRMVTLRATTFEEKAARSEAFDAVYDYSNEVDISLGCAYYSVWSVLGAAKDFNKLTPETVTALLNALGVEVCDD